MPKQSSITNSITFHPSGYDSSHSSYSSISSSYPITNAYDSASSTNYAYITCNTGSYASTYVSFTFDVSNVPSEATIDSVECTAKVRVSSTSYISTAVLQLYNGGTAKGSSTNARTTTATEYNLTPGTWTRSELDNIEVRYTGTRGSSNNTRAAYIYFYGADLVINYSVDGILYTVTATSTVQEVTVSPATQDILPNGTATVIINANDISDYNVTDNDVDIINELVRESNTQSGTLNTNLGEYTLVSGSFNSNATYFANIVGNGEDAATTSTSVYSSGSGTIAVFTYEMGMTVPSNAIINRVWCNVSAHAESTSNANEYMCAQLISGNTELSEEHNWKETGTTNTTYTLEATTLPTASQLASMKLQCRVGYYGGAINGATAYVQYEIPGTGYHYVYTITDIAADHVILVDLATAYIPPEEDPTYTYWPITISSINADTNPGTGTTRVIEGTNQTITITPTDPQLTLALDNGVDITSQLVGGVPNNTYTVTTPASADYGFNLNSSTGYYVSTNDGINKSASIARVNLDLESDCLVTFTYINYAEAGYDYGMFGKLDTQIAYDGLTASSGSSVPSDSTSNYQYICSSSSDNVNSTRTLTYEVSAGTHFIEVKYGKDDASNSGNDSLQWKVELEATSAGGEYTYTLTNITQKHSLIFVFGNVSYYFVTSTGTGCRLFPDGQQVKLEGQGYIINIVPDDIAYKVSITDNNVDKTSELARLDGVDKNNNAVVSYSYALTNITATHNLNIICEPSNELFWKSNGAWIKVTKIYYKENGDWREKDITFLSDQNLQNFVQG